MSIKDEQLIQEFLKPSKQYPSVTFAARKEQDKKKRAEKQHDGLKERNMLRINQQPGLKNRMKDRKNKNESVIGGFSFQVFPLSALCH